MSFVKHASSPRAAQWEAAGLDWLRAAGGATVVEIVAIEQETLALQRLRSASPTPAAAEAFGRALAATHAAGASAYGVGPDGWDGDGFQGPADDMLPLPLRPYESWGAMYADLRLAPLLEPRVECRRSEAGEAYRDQRGDGVRVSRLAPLAELAEPVLRRLRDGEFDGSCPAPARLHGDLWSGNVMWTADGAVLIDPAAHGGHPESDLAALALFGAPQLERLLASYLEAAPLADGWRDRVPLMQLHLVLLHAVLFGGGYVDHARAILRRYA
ncbi:fructosamine kinase family protein [Flexivirga oryzae]|uniref:Fructosamine-3-kinase n=1 Tax=Flexivirga oryzae TaxID=1794944 RepID=A0A839NAR8_9MICO|nr:fructosamine kinase family protein [Flexivirga oryzae]MBB2893084.1 fructosamine-3-kinase [Flexivirga oryzae]